MLTLPPYLLAWGKEIHSWAFVIFLSRTCLANIFLLSSAHLGAEGGCQFPGLYPVTFPWLLALLPGSLGLDHTYCSSSSRKPASEPLTSLLPWEENSDHVKEKGEGDTKMSRWFQDGWLREWQREESWSWYRGRNKHGGDGEKQGSLWMQQGWTPIPVPDLRHAAQLPPASAHCPSSGAHHSICFTESKEKWPSGSNDGP